MALFAVAYRFCEFYGSNILRIVLSRLKNFSGMEYGILPVGTIDFPSARIFLQRSFRVSGTGKNFSLQRKSKVTFLWHFLY